MSVGNALMHTGNSVNQQENSHVPSVEKDPEEVLDCKHQVKPALKQVRLADYLLLLLFLKQNLLVTVLFFYNM